MYRGERCRESLGCPDTPKNIKLAGEKRAAICHAIRNGTFNYAEQFPASKRAILDTTTKTLTVRQLFQQWLELKSADTTPATLKNYISRLSAALVILGEDNRVSELRQKDLLTLRKYWMETRKPRTVNTYMNTIKSVFGYAILNEFCDQRVLRGIKELKSPRTIPNPLSQDEFTRLIDACKNQQDNNLFTFAVYSGIRHGELMALSWDDVDLTMGTVKICRNITLEGEFKVPKTASGERIINLLQPALDALIRQRELTCMFRPLKIRVRQRDTFTFENQTIRPVFSPKVNATRPDVGDYYFNTAIHDKWRGIVRRAGILYRRPYQTRHTYACWMLSAGANPTFIAKQMGHSSAKEIYQTYGDWVEEHTAEQLEKLNHRFSKSVPYMPRKKAK
ncbi:site-specific integrase [Grimontia kaedaensis]|uniref:Site-specific integrase n=2 Tax=Grimontia kaedaensis TaxID=2872157 RepID=A0ABY4WYP2_9GAMM|nr:site-specific integrase [Grimontia kaedaensis]